MILIKGRNSNSSNNAGTHELLSTPEPRVPLRGRFQIAYFFFLPRSFSLNDLASCGFERTLSNMANMYAPAKSQKS